jgi:3alpha(or 20beta)-hydroxysteroid dehydrogenase
MSLEGKTALVTGAARGMGEAIARRFAQEGARVALADIREEQGKAVAAEIGDRAIFLAHDVTDEASWPRVMQATVDAFGGLDVLVNDAAILHRARIEEETLEAFERILAVNLVGVFLGIRAAIEPLRNRGGGSIINLSSTAGSMGIVQHAAYGSAKWGVRGLTKTAALELAADGIRCNSIHPGAVDTPMVAELGFERGSGNMPTIPLGRVGVPADIAAAALFLASDESSYITGTELYVDGGSLAGVMRTTSTSRGAEQ